MHTLPFAGLFRWLRRDAARITAPRLCAAALAVIAGLVYLPFLGNPPVFDDFNVVNGTDFLDYAFQFWIVPRWLPFATLAHTYVLTEGSIVAMRCGNLALHVASVVALFVLSREIYLAAVDTNLSQADRESRALVFSSLTAMVFAVHPVAVYAVGYLVQRTILMSTLFMLLMLIAYLRWLTTGRHSLWMWSAVWYALSVLSKEHSVMAPAVALLLTFTILRPSMALARRLMVPFAVYTFIAVLVTLMVKGVLGSAYEPYARDMITDMLGAGDEELRLSYPLSILTQTYLYFKYLLLWVIPNVNWMSMDIREPLAPSLSSATYWAAALAFLLYLLVAIVMALRGGRVGITGWLLAYPALMFVTEFSATRVQEPFVLYRAYLWFPLVGAVAALALHRLRTPLVLPLGIAVVCVLTPLSWNRLTTMSDTLLLWQDATKLLVRGDEPGAGRIYYNRAVALLAKGRKEEALADMDRVVRLHSKLAPVYYTRARVRFELKRYAEAEQDLNASIALNPNRAAAYFARGITLKRLGREDEALRDLRKSCELKDPIACYVAQQNRPMTGDAVR
jgi:tetratricopeptide (TPR) repeat protein